MSGAIPSPQSGVGSVHKAGALKLKGGKQPQQSSAARPPKGGTVSLPRKPKGDARRKGSK